MCSVTNEPFLGSGRRILQFNDLSELLNIRYIELDKSEILRIVSTLLLVKAENIYRNTTKMHKTIETMCLAIKQLF